MEKFFIFVGQASCIIIFSFVVFLVFGAIKDAICELKWKYEYKHRFDKPPKAECYCNDCLYHGLEEDLTLCKNRWVGKNMHTPNDWFCKYAKPREKEVGK